MLTRKQGRNILKKSLIVGRKFQYFQGFSVAISQNLRNFEIEVLNSCRIETAF